ncbi:bifunctional adenosylcobinamide kinase/adenosylcobinamide-phosphate guanylyltransferase [Metabacillus sp. 84]|uniref:bifunctional adenosylcobinamide kinase/adenosylcobinamide-phosphate guanylyltransferase n=1 Tax=Metabacillus sp. 84 TaxID=3404705 RepID=UPI003CE78CBB
MHFVTGGACNGKAKWVKDQLWRSEDSLWISAFKGDDLDQAFAPLTVVEGVETYIRNETLQSGLQAAENWKGLVLKWKAWETSQADRKLVLIGSDISKGIVPIREEDRLWRDSTGWVYQHIIQHADQADLIWYGIPSTLKTQ